MKRVVLITGAAGGIGSATAKLFSDQGWQVVGLDKKNEHKIVGIDRYIQADISSPEEISGAVTEIQNKIGRMDALINNAAMMICKPIIETDVEEWDRVMAVNLRAAFLLSKASYELLQESQGSIVNVSSLHAIATYANCTAYAASKGGIVSFTRSLAIEVAQKNIRVNSILPGSVDTQMLREGLPEEISSISAEEMLDKMGERIVIGRVATPEEIARGILFLADFDQSSYMTGQALSIDGGASARLSV
ncbi:MAG: SDR family NAD(P)-dependent oxidoreductase [Hormoscilla sp.]